MVNQVCQKLKVSERRACRVLALSRATHRYSVNVGSDEERLRSDIIRLALRYGRYGYRRITALLNNYEGWKVNQKRVYRIWRQEGLKVPQKQPKRGRLWLNNGSCIRLKPEFKDHVWSYDFVESRTTDGRKFRVLNIIDEYTRECLACLVGRSLKNDDVIGILFELFILRAIPMNIRSDNGSEFTAKAVIKWLNETGVKTLFIEPGSPWENGYIESFNGKMRDELLNGELFTTIDEAKYLLEKWRVESNSFRPHSSLGYMPPAPEAVMLGELTLQLV
jgi:transposase InsO family protein